MAVSALQKKSLVNQTQNFAYSLGAREMAGSTFQELTMTNVNLSMHIRIMDAILVKLVGISCCGLSKLTLLYLIL